MDHEHDEDDSPSRGGSLGPEGDVGGRGGASVRKAQNRLAQREFRMRKQQYIRDLEARVEVLSGDKEERVELMTLLIRNLLKENKDLRTMVKNMASFVGDGLGSCLPRLGLTAAQLDAILNRADTDTAHDAFLTLKASKEMIEANPGLPLGEVKRKASVSASASKRKREDGNHDTPNDYDLHSNSTPGGAGERYPKDEHTAGPSGTQPGNGNGNGNAGGSGGGNQDSANYDFLFPDLEAMANGRYPTPQLMTSPYNPFAHQSPFPFAPTPGYGGWPVPVPVPGPSDGSQDPNQQQQQQQHPHQQQQPYPPQPYGMGMGMGYGQTGQNQANFSGFGITMPGQMGVPVPGQGNLFSQPGPSSSNPPNPNPNSNSNPATTNLGSNEPLSSRTGNEESGESESVEAKRHRLKEAVARLTEGDRRVLEGNPMTPQEMQERFKVQEKLISSLPDGDQNNRMLEAMQMITYHLNNFRVNPNYVLPNSLKPTKVQKTIPHEHAIDGIIHPSIRDRMILLRGRYDIVEAFYAVLNEFRLNGEDPLDHNNWEFSERWINEFRILCDDEVFEITNRWRASRGERPIPKTENPMLKGEYGPRSSSGGGGGGGGGGGSY